MLRHLLRAICSSTSVAADMSRWILREWQPDCEQVFPLALVEVAQHPGNVWLLLLRLRGRPFFLLPMEAHL